ncbi:MAG: glutaredoxin family protein [Mariprofundaceae bacterium]
MSRKACCLCEDAEAALFRAVEKGLCPFEMVEVVDVDHELELAARYGADVPVLLIDGVVKMKHVINQTDLEETLMMLSEESVKC